MQVVNKGQHGLMTQPADLAEEEQVVNVHADLVHKYLEIVAAKTTGEDGAYDLHHNRHDINEVGRHETHGLLVDTAVHLVNGLGMSSSLTGCTSNKAAPFFSPLGHWHTYKMEEVQRLVSTQ